MDMEFNEDDIKEKWRMYVERMWRQDERLMHFDDWFGDILKSIEDKQPPVTRAATALGTLLAFAREAENATDLADIQQKARDVRARLANIERVELETREDLVENRLMRRVIDTLIRTAMKQGKEEDW
jgi:hypothetical protein